MYCQCAAVLPLLGLQLLHSNCNMPTPPHAPGPAAAAAIGFSAAAATPPHSMYESLLSAFVFRVGWKFAAADQLPGKLDPGKMNVMKMKLGGHADVRPRTAEGDNEGAIIRAEGGEGNRYQCVRTRAEMPSVANFARFRTGIAVGFRLRRCCRSCADDFVMYMCDLLSLRSV